MVSPIRNLLAVLSAVALLTGCSTVSETVDEWVDGDSSGQAPAVLQAFQAEVAPLVVWNHRVGTGTDERMVWLRHQIVENRVYAVAAEGEVEAYSLPSGEQQWKVELSESIMSGIAPGADNLYLGMESGRLVALSRTDGKERWSVPLLSEILAPVAEAEGIVVVRTADGKLTALHSDNGEVIWSYQREVPVLTLRGTGSPLIHNGRVYAGLDSGEVVALSLQDGRELWLKSVTTAHGRTEIERMVDIDADPVIAGDMLYVVSYQGDLAALDIEQGELLWKRAFNGTSTPVVHDGQLFVSDLESTLWALDGNDGSALWRQQDLANRQPTTALIAGKYLVVGDSEGYLHWLAQEDGRFVGRIEVDKKGVAAPPVGYGEAIVSYGESGALSLITP